MKRCILVFVLLAVSAGAQAQWVRYGSTSKATAYLWYPVHQYFPWAYPVTAAVFKKPFPVAGWRYRARSMLSETTVDCRNGRLKLRRATLYTGSNLNGYWVRVKYLILDNGLKIVPGPWYAYTRFSSAARKAIVMSCG